MRFHLHMDVYGNDPSEEYPERETHYIKVLKEWLRVEYRYYYYFETYKGREEMVDRSDVIISVKAVTELPPGVVYQYWCWKLDAEYEISKTELGATTRQRVLRQAIGMILGRQEYDETDIEI